MNQQKNKHNETRKKLNGMLTTFGLMLYAKPNDYTFFI